MQDFKTYITVCAHVCVRARVCEKFLTTLFTFHSTSRWRCRCSYQTELSRLNIFHFPPLDLNRRDKQDLGMLWNCGGRPSPGYGGLCSHQHGKSANLS